MPRPERRHRRPAWLIWKLWSENPETGRASGVYLFETAEAAEAYVAKHVPRLAAFGMTDPGMSRFTLKAPLSRATRAPLKETPTMYTILAEVCIKDLDRSLAVFSTERLEKRARHGSLDAEVLAPSGEGDRVLVLIDWRDRMAFEAFRADPEVPPIMAQGGAKARSAFTPVTRQGRLAA